MCRELAPMDGDMEGEPEKYMEFIVDEPNGWKHLRTMGLVKTICRSPSIDNPATLLGSLNSLSTIAYKCFSMPSSSYSSPSLIFLIVSGEERGEAGCFRKGV